MKKLIISLAIMGICLTSYGQFFPQKRKNLDIIGSFPYGMHINGHFSKTIPAGWYYNEWHTETPKKQKGRMIKKDGMTMVEIPACDKGMIGWTSNAKELFNPFRQITVRGMVKSSDDYHANNPRIFVTFFDKQSKFIGVKFYKIETAIDKWCNFKYILTSKDFPSETNSFRVNFVTSALKPASSSKPEGKIYFSNIFVSVPSSNGNSICLRGNEPGNIWSIDEKVTIKPDGKFPKNAIKLIGHIYDSEGKEVSTVVTPISTVVKTGWQWKSKEPGFYQVKFHLQSSDKKTVPIVEDYMMTSWINANWVVYTRHEINIAVLPARTRKPEDVPKVFGIHLRMPKYYMKSGIPVFEENTSFVKQLEFNFIRYHSVRWSDIEREKKGDLHWDMLDLCIDWAEKNGYESIINFYGTAKWASSSQDSKYVLGGKNYEAYGPAKISDFEDFVHLMVNRYKERVNQWEVWNEPHLPGSSCFWHDTPESFVKLLKSAYTTIKREQPDSTVWLGGIGMRYVPFYEKILSLGAGNYFDRLSLHGDWTTPVPFYNLDKKYGIKNKPWVNSEWHAFLVRYSMPNKYNQSDRSLSFTMVKDMMNQLKLGAQRITLFNISTQGYKEALEHLHLNGMANSCNAGLITTRPFPQPRFQCIAWQNFTTKFSGDIKFRGEFLDGKLKAAAFESQKGQMITLWHEEKHSVEITRNLKKMIGEKSKLVTWEGKKLDHKDNNIVLEPMTIYYLVDPVEIPDSTLMNENVLSQTRKKLNLSEKTQGVFIENPLFNDNGELLDNDIIWNTKGFTRQGKATLESRFAVAVNDNGIDLAVEVVDDINYPVYGKTSWKGDSVQFGLDLEGYGLQDARIEFYTKNNSEKIWLHKDRAPSIAGDLPTKWSTPRHKAEYAKVFNIKKADNKILYLIRVPNSELYPYQIKDIKNRMRFSLLINDNDGDGRKGWLEWGSGIGDLKDPTIYGTLNRNIKK